MWTMRLAMNQNVRAAVPPTGFDLSTLAGVDRAIEAAVSVGDRAALLRLVERRRTFTGRSKGRPGASPARDMADVVAVLRSGSRQTPRPGATMAGDLIAIRSALAGGGMTCGRAAGLDAERCAFCGCDLCPTDLSCDICD